MTLLYSIFKMYLLFSTGHTTFDIHFSDTYYILTL